MRLVKEVMVIEVIKMIMVFKVMGVGFRVFKRISKNIFVNNTFALLL